MDLYRDVNQWAGKAKPLEVVAFKINKYEKSKDGELVALMFHINLNMNMKYGYEVIYAQTSKMMTIKKLDTVRICAIPDMKVVGRQQVIS